MFGRVTVCSLCSPQLNTAPELLYNPWWPPYFGSFQPMRLGAPEVLLSSRERDCSAVCSNHPQNALLISRTNQTLRHAQVHPGLQICPEVVQSAPVGAQLQLQLKRFGFFDVNASAVVRCRPPQQHQLLRRLLRATWRALSTAQVRRWSFEGSGFEGG